MARFGFCGPTYQSLSVIADAQRTVNLMTEFIESDAGKSRLALYRRPGLKLFANTPDGEQIAQLLSHQGKLYGAGTRLYDIHADGTATILGALNPQISGPITMAANLSQILICSNGALYVYDLAAKTVTAVDMSQFSQGVPAQIDYLDGFFVTFLKGTNIFAFSSLEDGLTWPGANFGQPVLFSENLVSMVCDHRDWWLFGEKRSTALFVQGGLNNPIVPNPAYSLIEKGAAAMAASVRLDNTVYWIEGDERGAFTAQRLDGARPVRVSTHAVEQVWQQYPVKSDALAYAMQFMGHPLWVISFPSAKATWIYDAYTQMWTEWTSAGSQTFLGQCHAYQFGKHYMGDLTSGAIYEFDANTHDDNGAEIQWMRRAPHLSLEQRRMFHHELQVDMEVGPVLPAGFLDEQGNPREPLVNLRWSDDGGKSWSNYHQKGIGLTGEYKRRVIWRRLGSSRDRVYELSGSDPVPIRIVDAYLDADPGYKPTERLAAQMHKTA